MGGKGGSEFGDVVIWFDSRQGCLSVGCRCTGGLDFEEFGLYIVQVGKTTRASDRGIPKVAVGHCVDFYDKGWKEDVHTRTVHTNEATTTLALMGPKTVEGVAQVRYVKTVPDENFLSIERDDGRAVAKDWSKGVVAHPNLLSRDRMVRDERRFIREHMVRGAGVGNQQGGLIEETGLMFDVL